MHIPMTDLTIQYNSMKEEVDSAIRRVIESGRFILGPEVEALEGEMAAYNGTQQAIGVASGTDALILSLKACGIGPGDEVITTPFTFIATAEAVVHCGGVPVFVDIDPETYNLDPALIEAKITPRTRAIIPVHLFGEAVDLDPILALGHQHHLKIIEDCAQALSAEYKGKKVGSWGDAGCFSFFPAKNLGAFGDGGMVVTNNPEMAETVRMLRQHGAKASYYHVLTGFTSRLDALQAAILRVKLKYLDRWSYLRRQKASFYSQRLREVEGITPPCSRGYGIPSANYYTIRLDGAGIDRTELRTYLSARGIETSIYYPLSLHLQEVYRNLGYKKGDLPVSEQAQEQVLSLPLYPEISQEQMTEVIDKLQEYIRCRAAPRIGA
jgi:dTDP-4-amino-4,6-dideoxygalactose transaminase